MLVYFLMETKEFHFSLIIKYVLSYSHYYHCFRQLSLHEVDRKIKYTATSDVSFCMDIDKHDYVFEQHVLPIQTMTVAFVCPLFSI